MRFVEKASLIIFLAGLAYAIWGCCKTCPPPSVGPPAVIEKACELPPVPRLPVARSIKPGTNGCPERLFCYDVDNAMAIADRDGRLRQWVAEVVARCGKNPASHPTEARDAGSSSH